MDENKLEDSDDGQHFHPNWKTIATSNFKHKIFVKSSGTEDDKNVKLSELKNDIKIGESVSQFYQEVLSMPSKSENNTQKSSQPSKTSKNPMRSKIEKVQFSKEKLFRLALNNDSDGIENLINKSSNVEINAVDNFGWTALMMSACEGSADSFRVLLTKYNADLNHNDRTGNTAMSLAQKNNHHEILNVILEFHQKNQYLETSDEDSEELEEGIHYCPDCKIEISKSSSKSHQTSTVHLFSCKYRKTTKIKSFGISHFNKGYKLMKTIGWDGDSALGANRDGKMYPIKTVMRKGRTGLGVKQDDPKITHFKANDVRAVHYKSRRRALTKKEILEQSLKDKRREQMLRRELS